MKKNIIIALLLLCSVGVASAQTTLQSAYFMDRMTMRHKLNPALMTEYGYFAIPVMGDINFGVNSNLSLDNFLFPLESGQMGLFAHPDVNKSDFLDGLKENNVISQDLNLTIFSMGFHGFGGFNTLDISMRENFSMNLNKSFFEFLVGDEASGIYDMSGSSIDLMTWAEIGFGHAHKINDNLTIGVKLKYLMGAANANLSLSEMRFESTDDHLSVDLNAVGTVAAMGMNFDGSIADLAFDTFDMANAKNSGFAVDLGATYKMDKFTFSAALTDMGSINWSAPSSIDAEASLYFDGFDDVDINNLDGLEEQVEDLLSPFTDLSENTDLEAAEAYSSSLSTKMTFAAEYEVFECLSAGAISTTTFGAVTTTELMIAATYKPASWFNLSLTGTTSSYGTYWGWAMNFCPRLINFYIGSDCMVTKVTPQYVPYASSNLNLKFGLSIPLGRVHEVN